VRELSFSAAQGSHPAPHCNKLAPTAHGRNTNSSSPQTNQPCRSLLFLALKRRARADCNEAFYIHRGFRASTTSNHRHTEAFCPSRWLQKIFSTGDHHRPRALTDMGVLGEMAAWDRVAEGCVATWVEGTLCWQTRHSDGLLCTGAAWGAWVGRGVKRPLGAWEGNSSKFCSLRSKC